MNGSGNDQTIIHASQKMKLETMIHTHTCCVSRINTFQYEAICCVFCEQMTYLGLPNCSISSPPTKSTQVWNCYGVIPILFGWFLRVPSLHVLVFIQKTFFTLQLISTLGLTQTHHSIHCMLLNLFTQTPSSQPHGLDFLWSQLHWMCPWMSITVQDQSVA